MGKKSKLKANKLYTPICFICKAINSGGIYTNGDSGDGKYVGLDYGESHFYCVSCWEKGFVPDHKKEIDAAFSAQGLCGFYESYIGKCRNAKPCSKHSNQKCWKCGAPAVRNCDHTNMLVCGTPECAEHPHHPVGVD